MTSLKWSRTAVFVVFAVFGLCISTWAVHIPSVQERTGVSTGTLGTLLLMHGAGALVGMQACGPLINRWGSARVALVGVAAMAATLALPLNAPTPPMLGAALLIFGGATGITDVAMNARAVAVEKRVGTPIMSAFHAVFSVGSVVGSLIGAGTLAAEWSLPSTTVVMSGGCLLLVLIVAPNLLFVREDPRTGVGAIAEGGPVPATSKRRRLVLLGALAFLLLLSEGCAMDWSSLHAQERLAVSNSLGALVFGGFVTAMTVGRFTADLVSGRKGPVWVVRYGGAAAVLGIGIVIVSPVLPLTMVGWVIFGLGLSGTLPQVFTAAGNVAGATGTDFSRVVGCGYVALLAGPALIGWLSELVTLNLALLLPLVAVAMAALGARAVGSDEAPAMTAKLRSGSSDPCTK
ncbi:MFS transporter [Mycobacterium yunnanensis]|uniref:MFS transporter n=1 Tax=Mycobacterium yunnanensis TaxID=368477 RepID=A0A9X3C394_9MYCO|nr:MFS transporter [Mycobacterium yunnanensis]MCV7421702.1 MFS transporter [Mycobacterium yunnanensis]